MKKLIFPFLALIAICFLPACSEKFKIAAPYKNITVIYGLLDRADTAHYIRVQKAFLDQTKSALTMAQVADSSFYPNITVVMKELYMDDSTLAGSIQLNRVDLNSEGYPKQTGVFFNSPNYAYKFKGDLNPAYIYRLVVTNNATGEIDSADAPVIDDNGNLSFYITLLDYFTATSGNLDFANTSANETSPIRGNYTPQPAINFNFQGYSSPAYLVQAVLRFNWWDSVGTTGGAKTAHYYDFNLGSTYLDGNSFSYIEKNQDLFTAIATGLGTAPPNIYRLIDRCQLTVYMGTYDFNTYLAIQSLQGTGLTGNEIQPTYTNIKGKNVLGLFTSRGYRTGPVTLSTNTIIALKDSSATSQARVWGTIY